MVSLDSCLETESNDWESGNNPNTSDEIEQQIKLVSKRNTKSKARKYFGLTPNKDGSPSDSDTPKCRLCLKDMLARWAYTSNLLNHLKLHPISEYREILHVQYCQVMVSLKQTGSNNLNSV